MMGHVLKFVEMSLSSGRAYTPFGHRHTTLQSGMPVH